MDEYDLAFQIAEQAHKGQVDKSGKPSIEHPVRMSAKLTDPKCKCIALLHDVLEDSGSTSEDL